MTEVRGWDYSDHKRIVVVEGSRVRGEFVVLIGERAWVTPHDVVIWDEGRVSGRVLHSNAFAASVEAGVCDLKDGLIMSDVRADVLEVLDEVKAACVVAVETVSGVAGGVRRAVSVGWGLSRAEGPAAGGLDLTDDEADAFTAALADMDGRES